MSPVKTANLSATLGPVLVTADKEMTTDLEAVAVGTSDHTPVAAHAPEPARRLSRGIFSRVPPIWKALSLIAAIFATGVAGHAYLTTYTNKYATHAELAEQALRATAIEAQIHLLRESDVAQSSDILSIKRDTTAIREDVRTLLQVMLGHTPSDKPKKTP